MGSTGMAILGTIGFFVVLSLFSIIVVQRRWCKTTRRNGSDKCHVQTLCIFAYICVSRIVETYRVYLFYIGPGVDRNLFLQAEYLDYDRYNRFLQHRLFLPGRVCTWPLEDQGHEE